MRRGERGELDDGLNDRDGGRQSLALLSDPNVVLVPIVIRRLMRIVGQAHADQAHRECDEAEHGHEETRHDRELNPARHGISKACPTAARLSSLADRRERRRWAYQVIP
jgi:hypothetical protein